MVWPSWISELERATYSCTPGKIYQGRKDLGPWWYWNLKNIHQRNGPVRILSCRQQVVVHLYILYIWVEEACYVHKVVLGALACLTNKIIFYSWFEAVRTGTSGVTCDVLNSCSVAVSIVMSDRHTKGMKVADQNLRSGV